ncbi:hypothetical protein Taro_030482 [Colocasia esculenta]|uniref:Uncharacterized protein n=1 Tax=Colocasia esculenta TaxID=4460 RepID=A0A843VU50_COLES|nr:hypothetical protein [Colocasia esculenta]
MAIATTPFSYRSPSLLLLLCLLLSVPPHGAPSTPPAPGTPTADGPQWTAPRSPHGPQWSPLGGDALANPCGVGVVSFLWPEGIGRSDSMLGYAKLQMWPSCVLVFRYLIQ